MRTVTRIDTRQGGPQAEAGSLAGRTPPGHRGFCRAAARSLRERGGRLKVELQTWAARRTTWVSLPAGATLQNRKPSDKRFMGALGAACLLALSVHAGYRWWDYTRTWVKTDNAYVAAHIHQVSARVAGTVTEVLVEENQAVGADSVLARLDPQEFEVRHAQARAQVARSQAQARQATAQIAQARAQVAREQARALQAKHDLERAQALSVGAAGAISRQEFDSAQAAFDAAEAGLQSAQAALDSATAQAESAQAQEQVAQHALADTRLQLGYTELRAAAAGVIGRRNLETGNRVQPGQALMAVVEPELWVIANLKETQLTRIKPGAAARIRVDAFPGRVFTGRVESLAPASGAQFALLPPDNAIGNFTRIVQRVPVKLLFDHPELGLCAGRIVAGMSAVVEIRARD